jgi:hypothetical protein
MWPVHLRILLILSIVMAFLPARLRASESDENIRLRSRRQKKVRDFSPADPLRNAWISDVRLIPQQSGNALYGQALPLKVNFPNASEVWLDRAVFFVTPGTSDQDSPLVLSRLAYDIYIPGGASGRIQSALLMKDKDGRFYEGVCPKPLRAGRWNHVEVNLGDQSLQMQPRGHGMRWSLDALSTMQHIGFSVWADRPFAGTVLLDNITTWPQSLLESEEQKLKFVNVKIPRLELPQYERFEIECSINKPVFNSFDQDRIAIDAHITPPDAGQPIIVPAFFNHDFIREDAQPADRFIPVGSGRFCVRFTPRYSGTYRVQLFARYRGLDSSPGEMQSCESPEFTFRVTPNTTRGFVRISRKDRRCFEFENGDFFFPIGHNFRSPYDLRDWKRIHRKKDPDAPPPEDRGLDIYEEYLPRMAQAGENALEVWMCSWWLGLEWTPAWKNYHGLGRYNLENAWKLDRLIELCREHGVRIHLVIDNHGKASTHPQVDHEWELSPYNVENGGFLERPHELFTSEKAKRHYRNKLRYIAARWGFSTTIYGIELWSELDLIGKKQGRHRNVYASPEIRSWHVEMARYLRSQDHGRHPITTHYSGDFTVIDRRMVNLPEIDYIVCDAYHNKNRSLVSLLLQTDRFAAAYHKPYMITEFGGSPYAADWMELEAELHAGLWTSWMSRAAGSALFWWFEHIDRAELYPHFRAFANYVEGEDKRRAADEPRLTSWPVSVSAQSGNAEERLQALSLADGEIFYLWVYHPASMTRMPDPEKRQSFVDTILTVNKMKAKRYEVEIWDTWTGKILDRSEVNPKLDILHLSLPEFRTDIAVKIRRISNGSDETIR